MDFLVIPVPQQTPSPKPTSKESSCSFRGRKANIVAALNWLAVRPSHRLRGVGSLLMNVGILRADSLNLECWMEASAMGKPLYEKFGYQPLLTLAFNNERSDASDEWRKCAHEMTPPPIFAMWRPRRGIWKSEAGEDVKLPWDLGTA
jgi:GNAT superfamily N-acetyltransferase